MSELQLTEDQENASRAFTDFLLDEKAKYMVIQGAAGTGKSTLVKYLLNTIKPRMRMYSLLIGKKQGSFTIELTATTNKAAAVLAELSEQAARTVYSRLGLSPRQNFKTGTVDFVRGKNHSPIHDSLLVVDEASFISSDLFRNIDQSTFDSKILLVGDQYQLAPVKQIVPVMDCVEGHKVSLNKIMRHGGAIAESGAKYRESVKTGAFTPLVPNGAEIIHVDGPTFQKLIDDEFGDPGYTGHKARILAWTNDTVQQYNSHIRSILGLPDHLCEKDELTTNRPIIGAKGMIYSTDQRVKIIRVGNPRQEEGIDGRMVTLGDFSQCFLPDNQMQVNRLTKQLRAGKDFKKLFYIQDTWLDLRPVFASTVHKSQGSTYDTVYINLTDIGKCPIPSDVARMLYVAITRAARKVVLYGQLPPHYGGVCQ